MRARKALEPPKVAKALQPLKAAAVLLPTLALLAGSPPVEAQRPEGPTRPLATYSIVARDAATGQLGVAVQTHWFAVGSVVTWARPGVGAVATQSFVLESYGPLGLDLMAAGLSADEAMTALVSADGSASMRQVAMVDAEGDVAVHSGGDAILEVCDRTGRGFTVQANMMKNPGVCDAMTEAYRTASGDLAARMMAALEAAQGLGGDVRGRQSAALLVVSGDATLPAWSGRVFDIRVDDHRAPLVELRRLLTLARAYSRMDEGDDRLTEGDLAGALAAYREAHALAPDNHEMVFWTAVALVEEGRLEEALPLFRRAFEMWPGWRLMLRRLPAAGLLPDDEALLERILAVSGPEPG